MEHPISVHFVTVLLVFVAVFSSCNVSAENDVNSASEILSSIYDECLGQLSYPCLQKKVLVFVDRLDRVRSFSLAEGWDIVRKPGDGARRTPGAEEAAPITEEDLKSLGEGRSADASEEILHDMLDNRIVSFFQHRALKVSFPGDTVVSGRSDDKTSSMEISLEEDASEGRLKKKKKLKLKALLLGVLLLGGLKLIKLLPVLLALIKLKALKALAFASLSLFITLGAAAKGLIQRKLALFTTPMKHVKTVEVWLAPMKGGHGGSGDSHGAYSGGSSSSGGYSSGGHGGGYSSGGGHGGHGGGGGGGDSYNPSSYSSDSYSSAASHGGSGGNGGGGGGGGYSDSYSVAGGSYNSGGGSGWSSKSDGTVDAHNIAYRAHANV